MGGDGGSIPHRSELVKNKKKKEKLQKEVVDRAKWKHCALKQDPLHEPVVSCRMGRLYNKQSILEMLIDKKSSSSMSHIQKLKDIKQLVLTIQSNSSDETSYQTYACPIMGLEMNGTYEFVYSWRCGCVISRKAFKSVCDFKCLVDIIILNPTQPSDIDEAEKRTSKAMRIRKRKTCSGSEVAQKKDKSDDQTESTTETDGELCANNDPLVRATTSHIYKSLFTSSDEAKNQTKNNWVTFNPLYYR